MTRINDVFFLVFLLFSLISCDSGRIYETNQDFSSKYWHKDSIKSFDFLIEDKSAIYNLYINLRNTSNYPYQNIYVQFQLTDSANQSVEEELLDFQLFHSQTGAPFGKSGIGDIFDHQFMILENYRFPTEGKYTLHFLQMMRRDSLMEIVSVGARVEFFEAE